MRVLYLALDVNLNDDSGDAIHVREANRALAGLGAKIHLVVRDLPGEKQRSAALENAGVVLHSIPVAGTIGTGLICRGLAAKVNAEVIYERRYSPKVGVVVSRACALPLVVEVNGLPDVEMEILGKEHPGSKIGRALKFRLRKYLYGRVDRVVVVTPGLAQTMQTRFGMRPGRIVVIPNGADVDTFRPGDVHAAKRALGIPPARPVVGFVGTLYPWHGLHHLVAAAPSIVRDIPDVLFSIVGDGPERPRLEKLAQSLGLNGHFIFSGRVGHDRVPAYLQSFDVCIHLVATELYAVKYGSFALKLYEYMACGKPIVGPRYPGFEVLMEADCGLLVDPRDPMEVSRAIVSLLRDPARRDDMGTRARHVAVERYSWRSVAERLLSLMREVSN